jgi:hypothetical protein
VRTRLLFLLRTALGSVTSVNGDAVQRGLRAVVGLASAERERVKVVIGFFLLTMNIIWLVLPFASDVSPVVFLDLRELPRNVIFRAQSLTTFLERRKVARGHHTGAIPRGTWNRQRAGDLLISTADNVKVVLRTIE